MNFPTMNKKALAFSLSILLSIFCLGGLWGCTPTNATVVPEQSQSKVAKEDFFASWNDTATKNAIIEFVNKVTTQGEDFVEVSDRIAVFDNDGTLWSEKPMYFQIQFIKDKGPSFPVETEEYIAKASQFVYEENQEDFGVPYRQLVYKPVIGLVHYLKDNGFKVYICSGGDIDFVRSFSDEAYGIPREEVIGTAVITKFNPYSGNVVRTRGLLSPAQYNDQEGKPVGIENHIGKRPIIAVGNSGGDFEMLQYTDANPDKSLIVLINHDDCEREYKYNDVPGSTHLEDDPSNPGEQIEVPDNESLDEAKNNENWIVVSMKEDFQTIFYSDLEREKNDCSI